MTKKIYLLIVHGIGKPAPGYSDLLVKGMTEEFNQYLQGQLKTQDDYTSQLVIREVIWDGVLANQQEKLAQLLKKGFINHKPEGFRSFVSGVFSFVTRPLLKLRTDFAAEAISDILGYKNYEVYPSIHKCLSDAIETCVDVTMNPADKNHLSIVCHSLGTVISSDFVYDRQKKFGHVHENFILTNFFTLGSPIALFALQYGIELFRSPVLIEDALGQWMNIFDLDDPIAYPLKNLNAAYDQAVHVDEEVNTGGFGASHTRYFDNSIVQKKIAGKLAQDWRRLNNR